MTNYTEQALKAFLDSGGRLDQLLRQGNAQYFILSTDTKPSTANVGDELYYVDTGDYFVFYADEWHLKIEGNYTPITFTLTFDKADASAVSVASKEVTYDSAYGDLATTTYEGYALDGWFFDAELTDEVVAEDIVRIEADTTVIAKHSPIDYDITYNLDGGTNNVLNPATYTILDAVTFEDASKTGYTFDSWHNAVTLDSPVTGWVAGSTGDYEVWAKYLENFTVTFDSNEGSLVDAQEVADGSLATEPTAPTLDGSTFDAWYTDDGTFLNAYNFATPVTADITLYAKWV
jgi:uncharacterized repeat protein (TIGR02543 family)